MYLVGFTSQSQHLLKGLYLYSGNLDRPEPIMLEFYILFFLEISIILTHYHNIPLLFSLYFTQKKQEMSDATQCNQTIVVSQHKR